MSIQFKIIFKIFINIVLLYKLNVFILFVAVVVWILKLFIFLAVIYIKKKKSSLFTLYVYGILNNLSKCLFLNYLYYAIYFLEMTFLINVLMFNDKYLYILGMILKHLTACLLLNFKTNQLTQMICINQCLRYSSNISLIWYLCLCMNGYK